MGRLTINDWNVSVKAPTAKVQNTSFRKKCRFIRRSRIIFSIK